MVLRKSKYKALRHQYIGQIKTQWRRYAETTGCTANATAARLIIVCE
jgi:hypothetical protein